MSELFVQQQAIKESSFRLGDETKDMKEDHQLTYYLLSTLDLD